MGNILNHNRPIFEIKLSKSDYWDHHLYLSQKGGVLTDNMSEDCLAAYIDTTLTECIDENNLRSAEYYKWDKAVNTGVSLNNIGLTGVDNGLLTYDKDTITEEDFMEIYTNSKLEIPEDDMRLYLTKIDGNNNLYSYENEYVIEDGMNVAKLNGGFFQGFTRTDNKCEYQVLPTELGEGWTMEFTLKPENFKSEYFIKKDKYSSEDYNDDGWDGPIVDKTDYSTQYTENETNPTLNDINPENKGIFFYIGTRAENKWWKYYVDTEETTDIETAEGISVNEQYNEIETDNKFITYNRTKNGLKAFMKDVDQEKVILMHKNLNTDNYFIIMNRAKGGYTTRTIKQLKQESGAHYNILSDLYKNALGFQIKEDGSIGYKYMVKSCDTETGYDILSEWSKPGTVKYSNWTTIDVRIQPVQNPYAYDMTGLKYMRMMFYVDGKLVLYTKELPMLDLRLLNDIYSKQEGVPYNISLGGGTQGLADVVYEDYKDIRKYSLYLDKEFGGSFTGYLKSFKFYTCDKNYNEINSNVTYERNLIF